MGPREFSRQRESCRRTCPWVRLEGVIVEGEMVAERWMVCCAIIDVG